jgi:hypothetical protein
MCPGRQAPLTSGCEHVPTQTPLTSGCEHVPTQTPLTSGCEHVPTQTPLTSGHFLVGLSEHMFTATC